VAGVHYVSSEQAKRAHPKRKRRAPTPDDVQAILDVSSMRTLPSPGTAACVGMQSSAGANVAVAPYESRQRRLRIGTRPLAA
jgi:hypothetical protein